MNDDSQQKLNLIIRYYVFRIHWLFDYFYCPLYTKDCIEIEFFLISHDVMFYG